MKKDDTATSIEVMTNRRLMMPQFIPSASFESDFPKHVAHASAVGEEISNNPNVAMAVVQARFIIKGS